MFGVPREHRAKLEEDKWTLEMGLAFVLGCAHPEFAHDDSWADYRDLNPSSGHDLVRDRARERFSDWFERAGAAVQTGELVVADARMKGLASKGRYSEVWLRSGDLVTWCLNQEGDWEMPEELLALEEVAPMGREGARPSHPALDPEHPHHAKELAIALRAWETLFMDRTDTRKPAGGYRLAIDRWLSANCSVNSNSARERIGILVNPNHKGGASRS